VYGLRLRVKGERLELQGLGLRGFGRKIDWRLVQSCSAMSVFFVNN
jgi:hypothetical protein